MRWAGRNIERQRVLSVCVHLFLLYTTAAELEEGVDHRKAGQGQWVT